MVDTQDPIVITGIGRRLGYRLAIEFSGRGIEVVGTYRTDRPELATLENLSLIHI